MPAGDGTGSPFDAIREFDEHGREFWDARRLQSPLGYEQWRQFEDAIDRAQLACRNTGQNPADHFAGARKMVSLGGGAVREVSNWHLTRYACYLIAMNGDVRKPEIAAAQQDTMRMHPAEASTRTARQVRIYSRHPRETR